MRAGSDVNVSNVELRGERLSGEQGSGNEVEYNDEVVSEEQTGLKGSMQRCFCTSQRWVSWKPAAVTLALALVV